jgi:hypothetical protein
MLGREEAAVHKQRGLVTTKSREIRRDAIAGIPKIATIDSGS